MRRGELAFGIETGRELVAVVAARRALVTGGDDGGWWRRAATGLLAKIRALGLCGLTGLCGLGRAQLQVQSNCKTGGGNRLLSLIGPISIAESLLN